MAFDKNYQTKKLQDQYQRFNKRKDSLLNDLFQLVDRAREDLSEISKQAKEIETLIQENETNKVEEVKEEVKPDVSNVT